MEGKMLLEFVCYHTHTQLQEMWSFEVFFFLFMMSIHKVIHVSYFGQWFAQHCQWIINYTFLSCLDISSSHSSRPSSAGTESRQTFVLSVAPNSLAHIVDMWPIERLDSSRFFCPTLVRGWKIGHRAGWWIWVAFIIYESLWVTSSHLIIRHIQNGTNWNKFEYKLLCTEKSYSMVIRCSILNDPDTLVIVKIKTKKFLIFFKTPLKLKH